MNQASLGSICFALLWLRPENFIIPVLVLLFCPSDSSSYVFKHWMTLKAYPCAYLGWIILPMLRLPTPWSTCCSSLVSLTVSLGSLCAPSISGVDTMYYSFSLRSYVTPQFFHDNFFYITSLTILFLFFQLLWYPIGASEKKISVAGRLHLGCNI